MNIFVIPSWYPSKDYPVNGIMIKEQFEMLCRMYTAVNVGISLWGQKNEQYLLYVKDHLKNIRKVASASRISSSQKNLPNLTEYTKPAFTWTQKLAGGNIKGIVEANVFNIKAFEKEYGPVQIIHAQVGHPAGLIAMEVARKTGIPYIITERMGPFPSTYATGKNGELAYAYKQAYLKSAANIAVSPFQAASMQKYGIEKLYCIPNFTDELFFKPIPGAGNSTFTFFTLARIESSKGFQELFEAAALLPARNYVIRIGGTGSQLKAYKKLTKNSALSKNIVWLDELTREQALREYQTCHAFVLPSHYESFGIAYIEALACGKPVIATKCGGPESIVNETNGLLIAKNDAAGLAKAMEDMMCYYDRYDSQLIRQDFLNRFSKEAVLPQLYQFYKKIINKHNQHHANSTNRHR